MKTLVACAGAWWESIRQALVLQLLANLCASPEALGAGAALKRAKQTEAWVKEPNPIQYQLVYLLGQFDGIYLRAKTDLVV